MSSVKIEYYLYGRTLVAAYKKAGRLGAYSLTPKADQFQMDPQMLSTIDFDRSGLVQRISRTTFKQLARKQGVRELPLELRSPKELRFARTTKSQIKKTILPTVSTN